MYLAVDPDDNSRILIPAVGLPYADYDRVRDRVEIGSMLVLEPVDDNPHDPRAVEVLFRDGQKDVRVGFVPRDAAPGVRLALSLGALEAEVPIGQAGDGLALAMSKDVMVEFIKLAGASALRTDAAGSAPQADSKDWPYRALMPGDVKDLRAPEDDFGLLRCLMERLQSKSSDHSALKAAEKDVAEEPEYAADEHLFDVADALEEELTGVLDVDCDAACARDKIGGLPYCEEGWVWPTCPCCGQEMVFLGQSRDPANSDDLIQAFWCVDTIDSECDEGASLYEANSTVRIWRNPSPASLVTVRPEDEALILPGHRLVKLIGGDMPKGPAMSRDGIAHTHFNQCSYEDGRHRVFEICLGADLLNGEGPETYTVIRHGRGLVTSWEDWGG